MTPKLSRSANFELAIEWATQSALIDANFAGNGATWLILKHQARSLYALPPLAGGAWRGVAGILNSPAITVCAMVMVVSGRASFARLSRENSRGCSLGESGRAEHQDAHGEASKMIPRVYRRRIQYWRNAI